MAQTHTIWNPCPPQTIVDQFRNRIIDLRSQEKTDGISYCEPPYEEYSGTGILKVTRNWATETDAQEWIDFLLTLATPESYTITP